MAKKSTVKDNTVSLEEFLGKIKDGGYENEIKEWWLNDTLYHENDSKQTETELKKCYAFIQIYYHDNFRKSSTKIDQYIKELIKKVESEKKYTTSGEKIKKLRALVLGSAYRRLGQFKTERYQPAEAELNKAIHYLEQDTSIFELSNPENAAAEEENFVIMLLFLLNKAKYFRDIAERDSLRIDASYWRAIMLFKEIKKKIEERQEKCPEEPIEGVLARIYLSAWINIAQVYRFQQEYGWTIDECIKLIDFCICSLENKEKKKEIREIVVELPKMKDIGQGKGFSVKKFGQGKRNADYLFEDYILQALLQLGISYRDRVDFNGSLEGNFWVRQAIGVFLVLGIVDCIKDKSNPKKIVELLDMLREQDPKSMNVSQELVVQIREVCISEGDGDLKKKSVLKNADAQNNLAVCLKKLGYCTDAIDILTKALKRNRFAEYNLYKSYLESGLIDEMGIINWYCAKKEPGNSGSVYIDLGRVEDPRPENEDPKESENPSPVSGDPKESENPSPTNGNPKGLEDSRPVYVYPDEPEKSNYKWLFLYARYLFAQKRYEAAEKMFSHIRNNRAMRWDSLELKAAYLEAQCQIKREKNLSAIASLSNIHESLLKLGNEKQKRQHEIRTEIDLGWCLIMEDRYEEAQSVYGNLLAYLVRDTQKKASGQGQDNRELHPQKGEQLIEAALKKLKVSLASVPEPDIEADEPYKMKWYAVDSLSQERILHNLYDCWTYLHNDPKSKGGIIPNLISEICVLINKSDIYIRYLQGLRTMNQIMRGDVKGDLHNEWKDLSSTFGEILKDRPSDIMTYSCWVIGKVNYCMGLSRQQKYDFETQKRQLLLGLVSSTTPITMKSYIEAAQIILNRNGNNRFLDISTDTKNENGMELERAFLELFCHVNLLENGTNQAFMALMTNQNFHSIELVTRAELLANIVQLYGDILQMKTQLRVTYNDLEAFVDSKQDDGANKKTKPIMCQDSKQDDDANKKTKPIICQYTKLSTLKGILPKAVKETNGDNVEKEPRFRMSSAARMNDASEGAMFRKICENIAKHDHIADNEEAYNEIIRKYIDNRSGYNNTDEISSYDSDVYIASFSMNRNNFGLWCNYADKEKGCIIGFDQSFFDLVDKNYYSILDDEVEENALYRILYVNEQELIEKEENLGIKRSKGKNKEDVKTEDKDAKDVAIIRKCIPNILQKLSRIEEKLQDDELITPEAAGVIRAFIVDRLNEIRFLFKSVSYAYEEEMRMLRCSQNPEIDIIDSCAIPWLYINVEKKIDNLTLILGSKVDMQQVKELSVWAKSTGRVKQVIWSGLNRI